MDIDFPISADGATEALRRSSSALVAANNTFEESLGLIVAMNSVLQNPAKVGTALNTISQRLRNTTGELEALGESGDHSFESITRLQQRLFELTDNRVDIMVNEDTFKSTYQIIREISKIFHELTDVQQAEVTQILGGVRQAQAVTAKKCLYVQKCA